MKIPSLKRYPFGFITMLVSESKKPQICACFSTKASIVRMKVKSYLRLQSIPVLNGLVILVQTVQSLRCLSGSVCCLEWSWWRHQMEAFSALLALCTGNSPVTGEFPSQRPVTRSFDVFFDLRLKQQLSKQWRRQWFETPWRSLWRHCNGKSPCGTLIPTLANKDRI